MTTTPARAAKHRRKASYSINIDADNEDGSPHGPVAPNVWLSELMKNRQLTDGQMLHRMQGFGFEGTSRSAIAAWRRKEGAKPIPIDALPAVCLALGLTEHTMKHIVSDALHELFPKLAPFFRDPLRDAVQKWEDTMKRKRKAAEASMTATLKQKAVLAKLDELTKLATELKEVLNAER